MVFSEKCRNPPRDYRDVGLVEADPLPLLTRVPGFPVSLIWHIIKNVKLY